MNDWMEEKGFIVNEKIWKDKFWPNYIAGPCVIMSSKAALKIGASSRLESKVLGRIKRVLSSVEQIPQIPVEDAVFTGILRVKNCLEIGTLNYFSFLWNRHKAFCVHTQGNIRLLQEKINETLFNI